MKIKSQIEAATELLKQQGLTDDEVKLFDRHARAMATKSISLLAQHYRKLLELARLNKAKDSDALAASQFSLGVKLDVSDLNVCKLDIGITYTQAFKQKDGVMVNVDDAEEEDDDTESDMPLFDQAIESDGKEEEGAGTVHEEPVTDDVPQDEELQSDPEGEPTPPEEEADKVPATN